MKMVSTKVAQQTEADSFSYDGRPRIYLSDDIVEQLGLKGIPAPGAMFKMQAMVVAESVTATAEEAEEVAAEGATPDVTICLILTDVGLQETNVSDAERARSLYGSDEG